MKLLVLDVEGTLFKNSVVLPDTSLTSTVWQGLAALLGEDAVTEEVATHEAWNRGDYRSYLDWMKASVDIHRRHGLTRALFDEVIDGAEYNEGVRDFFEGLDRATFEPVLVSGGFRALAARAQMELRIDHAFTACDYMFDASGRLAAINLLPCDFYGKIDFIELMLREYRLTEDDWVFVGDGANDEPIAVRAPVSIGYRPHPLLARVVTHVIDDFRELAELLVDA